MMTVAKDGTTITAVGSTITCSNGETYTFAGNMLTGGNGHVSVDVTSLREAMGIVAGLHGGKQF